MRFLLEAPPRPLRAPLGFGGATTTAARSSIGAPTRAARETLGEFEVDPFRLPAAARADPRRQTARPPHQLRLVRFVRADRAPRRWVPRVRHGRLYELRGHQPDVLAGRQRERADLPRPARAGADAGDRGRGADVPVSLLPRWRCRGGHAVQLQVRAMSYGVFSSGGRCRLRCTVLLVGGGPTIIDRLCVKA